VAQIKKRIFSTIIGLHSTIGFTKRFWHYIYLFTVTIGNRAHLQLSFSLKFSARTPLYLW
jgi:hypothetical protein